MLPLLRFTASLPQVLEKDLGIGGVVSLLWFRRQLPDVCLKFLEMALMVCADHGPAVRAGQMWPTAQVDGEYGIESFR